jgi:hypothetical protein
VKTHMTSLLTMSMIVTAAALVSAQGAPAPEGPHLFERAVIGPPLFGPMFEGPLIEASTNEGMLQKDRLLQGQPYSATTVTEMNQTLADGNRIVRRTEGKVYRDSAGRTRTEHTLTGIGSVAFGPSAEGKSFVSIQDPVAHTAYVLDLQNKLARQMPEFGGRFFRGVKGEVGDSAGEPFADAAKPVKESLGTRMIEGVQAQGTRTTFTIPAGQIGNEAPIEIVNERWYEPTLKVLVLSRFSDPRIGERTFTLTNIQRGEPAAELFLVPSDYQIETAPRFRETCRGAGCAAASSGMKVLPAPRPPQP